MAAMATERPLRADGGKGAQPLRRRAWLPPRSRNGCEDIALLARNRTRARIRTRPVGEPFTERCGCDSEPPVGSGLGQVSAFEPQTRKPEGSRVDQSLKPASSAGSATMRPLERPGAFGAGEKQAPPGFHGSRPAERRGSRMGHDRVSTIGMGWDRFSRTVGSGERGLEKPRRARRGGRGASSDRGQTLGPAETESQGPVGSIGTQPEGKVPPLQLVDSPGGQDAVGPPFAKWRNLCAKWRCHHP